MDNKKLKITRYLLVFLLVSSLCLAHAQRSTDDFPLTVNNLVVQDIPHDEGSGLRIEWQPLPFEARVISYRIYRGISPDSLFYIGELPVNPKIRLATPTMSFYDRDWNNFMNIVSPGRMKKERGVPADSPLYRALPRDVNVLGPMMSSYSLLGVIPNKEFYFRTTLEEQNERFYAGLKPNQLTIAKKLIPGNSYYYTVVAVNERRTFYPHAEPVIGIPTDNPPEYPGQLFGVYVQDINALQFEWEVPNYWDDIRFFAIYAVENGDVFDNWYADFSQWKHDYDDWANNIAIHQYNIPSKEEINEQIQNFSARQRELLNSRPATMIWRFALPQPYTPPTFAKINLDGMNVIEESIWGNNTYNYTFNRPIEDYKFVLAYIDYANLSTFSNAYAVQSVENILLPELTTVTIQDQKNDKGDYLDLLWNKPFARITSVSYLNESRTSAQFNYEFSTNDHYKVRNIYFEFTDENGNFIARRNQFFQSEFFKLKNLPADISELNVKITFRTKQDKEIANINANMGLPSNHDDRYLTQKLIFDQDILTLRPQELIYNDFVVENYNFQVLKRTSFTNSFRMSKKVPFFDRQTNDLINFEASVFKNVANYCPEKKIFLVDYNIDLIYDYDAPVHVNTPMFAAEVENALQRLRTQVDEYHENYANAETDDERQNWQEYIDFFGGRLNAMENNETLQYVNSYTNQRERARAIRRIREPERRAMSYQVLLSDGKGMFMLTDLLMDEQNNPQFMLPVPNWFHTERIPTLIATLVFGILVTIFIQLAKKGKDLYIRPIAGIEEIDNAIGRATEMGRPILFCPGLSGISDVATLAGLSILSRVAKKAAEYDTRILVPCRDYIVLPIAQEIVREAHSEAGRPDSFDKNNVFFVSDQQFAYVAGVNGVMVREKTATNFYMGMFWAESLIMTETGNQTGAIQIAGTDAATQIPFFITTCDYTLIGEELYAASAYMSRQPLMLGTLKAQDYTKFIILTFLIFGSLLSTFGVTAVLDWFPTK